MSDWTFGFSIKRRRDYTHWKFDSGEEAPLVDPPEWNVYLPHQCDEWHIYDGCGDGEESQARAIADLEKFIAEAQHALTELRAGRELDGERE